MGDRRFRTGALGSRLGAEEPEIPDTGPITVPTPPQAPTTPTDGGTTPTEQMAANIPMPFQPYTGDVVQNIQSLAGVQQWMMGLSFTQTPGIDSFFANEPGGTPPPEAYTNTGIDYGVYEPAQTTFVQSPELTGQGDIATQGPAQLGLEGNLTQVQLAEAARLTALSIFGPYFNQNLTGSLPNAISIEVLDELAPFITHPGSEAMTSFYMENFGITNFDSVEQFAETLGYIETEPGKWYLPPAGDATTSGAATLGGQYYTPTNYGRNNFGYNYSPRGAYAGGNLINWRI